MKTIRRFLSVALGSAVAVVLVGCSSIELGPDDSAPPVRFPDQVSTAPAPVSAPPPGAQALPVQPVPIQAAPVAPEDDAPAADVPPPNSDAANPDAANPGAANPPNVDAHLVTLSTHLDGADAVPPTDSGATAQIDAVYDSTTRLLRWKATWSNLSGPITDVRFYGPAAQGQQGPATLIWPGPFGTWYEGRATLLPQQATDLLGGLWYVNIRTTNYPGGEIRGQLRVVY